MSIAPFLRRAGKLSRRSRCWTLTLGLTSVTLLYAQIPGRNVNMVSGTTWPTGDPFLERQNEPSIAASTRNPLHLLAGANDYRTVDLPVVANSQEHGDAWLGLFKSFDGGQTWQSTLLPGCQYATAACAGAPFTGIYQAGSDPVVRAGTNGLFYYSGIAFQRDQSAGVVFVARYIDNNNNEAGDPIQYAGTSVVSSGNQQQFLDKPWIAVDVPRPGALTCTVNGQSFLGGNVYIAYASFVVGEEDTASSIVFSRSRDCGVTWSQPIQITDNSAANQGATFAIDPNSGTIYLAWRQFAQSAGSILVSKSTDGGLTFQGPFLVANLTAFDQSTSLISFRTNAYPSLVVDGNGVVYVAWADRTGSQGDARIVVSSSTDGQIWSTPQLADPSQARGHQWMPALTFTGGNLTLVYYDSRNDHMQGVLVCPLQTCVAVSDYVTTLQMIGNDNPANIFNAQIADTSNLMRRHTIDVRVAQSPPGPTLSFSPSVQVSQYLFGSSTQPGPEPRPIDQLRFNPPNLPMFAGGTEAFMGDYIDLTPTPAFIPVVTGTRTVWRYNLGGSTGSLVQAAWTDNRDVIPPPNQNWMNYTPPEPSQTSVFDPTKQTPPCMPPPPGQDPTTGMRNQNIYSARIAAGVVAGSPGNTKPLSQTLERAFVVFVENTSSTLATYRLTIPPSQQPPNGYASFLSQSVSATPLTQLDVSVAPLSSISRTVFVESSSALAQITINIIQITAPGGVPVPPGPGTQTSVTLNPDLTNPDLTNPDLTNEELYNPDLTNLGVNNPDLTNPDLTNPDLTNPDLTNPDLTNPDVTNNGVPTPDLTNPDLTNPDLTNPNIQTPDLTNPDLTNMAISDTFWTVTNNGNTSAAYSIKLLLRGQAPASGVALQLLLYKLHTTPAAEGCTLVERPDNELIANIINPNIINPAVSGRSDLTNPDLTNPDVTNATLSLSPGDTARIDLRTAIPPNTPVFSPSTSITAVSVAQSANTGTTTPPVDASHLTIITVALPSTTSGNSYSAGLGVVGHPVGAVTWALTSGTLPPGLSLNPQTGVISGTVTSAGTFTFTVSATDSATPPDTDSTTLTIVVNPSVTSLTITSPSALPTGTVGVFYSYMLTAAGGLTPYKWAVLIGSLPPGLTLDPTSGVISGTPTTAVSSVFGIQVSDSSSPQQTASQYPVGIIIQQ